MLLLADRPPLVLNKLSPDALGRALGGVLFWARRKAPRIRSAPGSQPASGAQYSEQATHPLRHVKALQINSLLKLHETRAAADLAEALQGYVLPLQNATCAALSASKFAPITGSPVARFQLSVVLLIAMRMSQCENRSRKFLASFAIHVQTF